MGILVSTVLTNVTTLLNDVGMVHWTQAELLAYGSEGQVELVKLKPDAATKTTTLQLVAGAKQTNPTGCIEIIDMRQNNNGKAITPCDRAALDRFAPNWMTTPTASYVTHYMDDPQPDTFYVYPAQNATPATVVMTPEQFAAANTNGDDGVSKAEFEAATKADVAAADKDGDGALHRIPVPGASPQRAPGTL